MDRKGENDLIWCQGSLLLWQHNGNVCVCVYPGGLFDDQFQEFGIRVRLRFKEREKKGQEERKKRAGRRGGAEERLRVS